MSDTEQQMQLVAKLVDGVSDKLRTIQRNMLATEVAVRKSHEGAGKAAAEHTARMKALQESFAKTKSFVADAFTPALATLGITAFGVGEAIGKVAEQIKGASEKFDLFNATIKRGHVGVQYVDQLRTMYRALGIDAGRANDSIAEMGETFDKLNRANPEEMARLQGTFGNMLPFIREAIRGARNYADAEDQIVDAIKRKVPLIDQQRKAFEALHMPPELADKSLKEIEEARARGRRSALTHPTDLKALKELNEAYTQLGVTQSEFWRDLTNDLAPAAAKAIKSITNLLKELDDTYRDIRKGPQKLDNPNAPYFGGSGNWLDRLDMALGFKPRGAMTPQDRINGAFGAFDNRKTEESIAHGTKEGVLDALRQFSAEREGKFAPGLKPQAYHPDADTPRTYRFGSSSYPLLDLSAVPRSARGVTDMLNGGGGVGILAGDDKVGATFDRSRFARELAAKPWLKDKIFQLAAGEDRPSRGESLLANQAVMETMMNRAIVRGTDLETQAKWYGRERGGYYAGRPSHLSALERANSEANLRKVLGGSNITDYATDNSSGGLAARERASGKFKYHTTIHGESFFSPGWAEPGFARRYAHLREQMQEAIAARHGTGAHLRDHIRHKDLLTLGRRSGLIGAPAEGRQHLGNAGITVDFKNMPRGIRTSAAADGVFKEVRLNRGFQMALASSED